MEDALREALTKAHNSHSLAEMHATLLDEERANLAESRSRRGCIKLDKT
jgi:hypothetical protein